MWVIGFPQVLWHMRCLLPRHYSIYLSEWGVVIAVIMSLRNVEQRRYDKIIRQLPYHLLPTFSDEQIPHSAVCSVLAADAVTKVFTEDVDGDMTGVIRAIGGSLCICLHLTGTHDSTPPSEAVPSRLMNVSRGSTQVDGTGQLNCVTSLWKIFSIKVC